MGKSRQTLWLCLCLFFTGCVGLDPTPLIYNRSPFSHTTQTEANSTCAPLFNDARFSRLSGKIPTQPGEIPTRAMLAVNEVPGPEDVAAIQALEGAMRTCRHMRAAAGEPTSATEDILASRISKLRYGLYNGSIPYAVYNWGVAQALKSHNAFLLDGEKAAQMGRKVGQEKATQAFMMSQFAGLGTMLSAYERNHAAAQAPNWTCNSTATADGTSFVDCY